MFCVIWKEVLQTAACHSHQVGGGCLDRCGDGKGGAPLMVDGSDADTAVTDVIARSNS